VTNIELKEHFKKCVEMGTQLENGRNLSNNLHNNEYSQLDVICQHSFRDLAFWNKKLSYR